METNNIINKALVWWENIPTAFQNGVLSLNYFDTDEWNKLTDEQVVHIYIKEHPQEYNVESLEDAARKQYYNIGGFHEGDTPLQSYISGAKYGAILKEEQMKPIVELNGELLDALYKISAEYDLFKSTNNQTAIVLSAIAKKAIEKANKLLNK